MSNKKIALRKDSTVGYLCNAVVNALARGVPVLTNSQTLTFGYNALLIPNKTCIVRDTPQELLKAVQVTDYGKFRANCLELTRSGRSP